MAASPVLPKLVGQRVKRREDPRLIQGRGTYVDDVKIAGMQHLAFKRSDVAHGRILLHRHERRGGGRRRRGGLHRRADRGVPRADADRHAVPVPGPSRGGRRRGALRGRAGGRRRGARPLRGPRRRRRHQRRVRPAAARRRSRAGADRRAGRAPRRLPEQRGRRAAADRHRRVTEGRRRHGDRPGVRGGRRRRLAAHGQPPARAHVDRAAGRRRPLRAGQGRDDHLVVDPESAHPAHVHRLAHRPRAGPGAGDRAGSGRRVRLEDQHLRRGVRRRRAQQAARPAPQVGGGPLGGVPLDHPRARHHRLGRPRGAPRRRPCLASRCAWWPTSAPTTCCSRRPSPR